MSITNLTFLTNVGISGCGKPMKTIVQLTIIMNTSTDDTLIFPHAVTSNASNKLLPINWCEITYIVSISVHHI